MISGVASGTVVPSEQSIRFRQRNQNTVVMSLVSDCNCGCKIEIQFTARNMPVPQSVVHLGPGGDNDIAVTILAGCECGCRIEILMSTT